MTFPNTCKERFILHPSRSLSPSTFVCFTRSLPARSTTCNLALRYLSTSPSETSLSTTTVKIACDRDDYEFIIVLAIFLVLSPSSSSPTAALYPSAFFSMSPSTKTPFLASSRIWWIRLSPDSWLQSDVPSRRSVRYRFPCRRKTDSVVPILAAGLIRKGPITNEAGCLGNRSMDHLLSRANYLVLRRSCRHRSVHTRRYSNCSPAW